MIAVAVHTLDCERVGGLPTHARLFILSKQRANANVNLILTILTVTHFQAFSVAQELLLYRLKQIFWLKDLIIIVLLFVPSLLRLILQLYESLMHDGRGQKWFNTRDKQ